MPFPRRCRWCRLPANWGTGWAAPRAPSPYRQSWAQNPPCPCLYPPEVPWKSWKVLPLCNAWPPPRPRPWSRSFHARPPEGISWSSPGPCSPERRRWSCPRGDGIYPWYRPQYGRSYGEACRVRCSARSWNRALCAGQVLSRPSHREGPWPRLHSWHSRCRMSPFSLSGQLRGSCQKHHPSCNSSL